MAMLPRALRPAVLIRRKAMYSGIFGQSTFWKVVAAWVFGKASIKKFFGKNEEVIDTASMGSGRIMQVVTQQPVNRRQRKQLAKAGMEPPSLKEHRELARLWAESEAQAKAEAKSAAKRRSRFRRAS